MSAAETTDLAAQADGVVLVVAPRNPVARLEDARQRLAMSGTPILGYVFNRAHSRSAGLRLRLRLRPELHLVAVSSPTDPGSETTHILRP